MGTTELPIKQQYRYEHQRQKSCLGAPEIRVVTCTPKYRAPRHLILGTNNLKAEVWN